MIYGKTYIVGGYRCAVRVIDYTNTSEDINSIQLLSNNTKAYLYDVMSDPDDFNNAITIGDINHVFNDYGIWKTSNGGITWIKPNGNYQDDIPDGGKFKEVWYVDSNTIYACANDGIVAKSTDGGDSFNLVSGLVENGEGGNIDLYSIHFYNTRIGVVGMTNNIAYTTDGGSTWNTVFPNGMYDTELGLSASNERVVGIRMNQVGANLEVIALTNKSFIKIYDVTDCTSSILTKRFGRYDFLHLTWLKSNLNTLWISGERNQIYQSTDNGDTWTTKQSEYIEGVDRHAAHYISRDNTIAGYHSGEEYLYLDNDQGSLSNYLITTIDPANESANELYAVWTDIDIPKHYKLTACDDQDIDDNLSEVYVSNDLSDYVDNVIKFCYSYDLLFFSFYDTYQDGADNPDIIKITLCDNSQSYWVIGSIINYGNNTGGSLTITVGNITTCWTYSVGETPNNGELIYDLGSGVIADVVEECGCELPNLCICYEVEEVDYKSNSIELSDDIIEQISTYDICESCTGTCYILTNCFDETDIRIISNEEFESYVGQIISLDDCTDNRFTVGLSDTCVDSEEISYEQINTHDVCEDVVEEEISFKHRAIKPGYYTDGCDPAYTEKVNCKFAEELYMEMSKQRYGVKICCDINDVRYAIKKKLLDLKAIGFPEINCVTYNSNDCCTTSNNCNC